MGEQTNCFIIFMRNKNTDTPNKVSFCLFLTADSAPPAACKKQTKKITLRTLSALSCTVVGLIGDGTGAWALSISYVTQKWAFPDRVPAYGCTYSSIHDLGQTEHCDWLRNV